MKKEKIEELFEKNADIMNGVRVLFDTDFVQAINQAEKELKLEWYKKLGKKLDTINHLTHSVLIAKEYEDYQKEIQNKIKELEDENN